MGKKLELIKSISGLEAYISAPFDVALKTLQDEGYQLISLKENARLRIRKGARTNISRDGNWVREGFLYLPDRKNSFDKNECNFRKSC